MEGWQTECLTIFYAKTGSTVQCTAFIVVQSSEDTKEVQRPLIVTPEKNFMNISGLGLWHKY